MGSGHEDRASGGFDHAEDERADARTGRARSGAGAHTVDLDAVTVAIDGTRVLHEVTWSAGPGERWVVVGPNGAGKTTLMRLLAGWLRTVEGTATVLGRRIGRTDLRSLRPLIGYSSQSITDLLRPSINALDAVVSGANGALETWWHAYGDDERNVALDRLASFGVDEAMARRPWTTLSAGERQRVLLARAFAGDPALVVLDEPTAGLDVGGREDLVGRLQAAAGTAAGTLVLVTHHLEEIPPAFDRVLLLDGGRLVGAGEASEVMTSERMSALYRTPLRVERADGRWRAIGV